MFILESVPGSPLSKNQGCFGPPCLTSTLFVAELLIQVGDHGLDEDVSQYFIRKAVQVDAK